MSIKNYYKEAGEGFPLILLHGNGENHEYFIHQIARFSKTHWVLALDTRGHGKTPRGHAPFTIAQFAEDLKLFFDEHKIQQADILGFSDGGNIAMAFATKYPECVRNLILNGVNLDSKGVKASVQIPITIGYRITSLFASKSPKARQNAELLGLMVHDPNVKPEDLRKIKARTLVIAGTKDMIKRSHTELIARSIKDAELVFLEGDHFIANKRAEAFNGVVERFLQYTNL
ncbi:alpha/beta hydrolase [Candidatus Merdisoma sp. JLR.KK006]|uniref:alpha/beta fold hydrolase n=1 Tax=Candidatus Merdisoma sp. JLR.KK006 TaxID=3112626 RepID=UPI002FF43892